MQGYVCAKRGVERPAVAPCRSCSAGLCLDQVRETAARFESDNMLASCHHDTWTPIRSARANKTGPAKHTASHKRHGQEPAGGLAVSARPGWRVRARRLAHPG